jgi:hypothetical protein
MTRFRAVLLASLIVAAAVPAAAHAKVAPGTWSGITYPDNVSKFTFTVHGSRISHFVDRAVGCYAYPGYQVQTITLPGSARIAPNGSFTLTRHPVKGATDTLKGRFKGATASGTLTQKGVCDTGTQKWVARAGKTPPKPPKPPKLAACTKSSCKATDGLVFKVTGVDTQLTSEPNQAAAWDSDLGSSGGVLIELTASNSTAKTLTFTTPNEWTLSDPSGHHYAARNETGFNLVTSDGKIRTDSSTCGSQLYAVPAHRKTGTISLCFVYAAGSSHKGLQLLFDYPTTMAKIPLG